MCWLFSGDDNEKCYFSIKLRKPLDYACHADVPALFLSTHSDALSLIFKLDTSGNWPEVSVCTWALVPRKKVGLLNEHVKSALESALHAHSPPVCSRYLCFSKGPTLKETWWVKPGGAGSTKQAIRRTAEETQAFSMKRQKPKQIWELSSNSWRE